AVSAGPRRAGVGGRPLRSACNGAASGVLASLPLRYILAIHNRPSFCPIGSCADRVVRLLPRPSRSTHGEIATAQAGRPSFLSRRLTRDAMVSAAPAEAPDTAR